MPVHTRLGLGAALLATAALAAPALALPGAPASSKEGGPRTDKASSSTVQPDQVVTCTDDEGRTVATATYSGAQALWPPNHKYVPGTATFTEEDPDDALTVMWTASHDQQGEDGELPGSGNTQDDIVPSATPPEGLMGTGEIVQQFQIRAERSGTDKAGRTYTIAGTIMTTDSDMDDSSDASDDCAFTFTIVVPHDQRRTKA